MTSHNLYAAIAAANGAHADRLALQTDNGEQFRFAEIDAWTARYANALVGHGAKPGDRVAVQIDKSAHALFVYLACLRAGLVYLPLNTAYRRGELEYFFQDAQPRIVVGQADNQSLLEDLCRGLTPCTGLTLNEDGAGSLGAAAAAAGAGFSTAAVAADQLSTIVYTSGTTGRPKGAMVTHGNLISNARALISIWAFTERDVLLHALPIFHVHGLFVANHCALLSGAKLLWHRKFDSASVMRDLPGASVFMGVPTFYTRLLSEPDFGREHAQHVRLFVSGSAPLLAETFARFQSRTGQAILERYGMSEAGMIASNPLHGERRAGTVGFPLPGVDVRIADSDDRPLPTGHTGMIQVRGPNVFSGYWKMPDRTRDEFTAGGWFRTGDVGCFDADGYLAIVGRAKDLIITGGYNVYPKEIELAIDRLPGVAESAVLGVPHPDFGEAVTAAVVAVPGAVLDESELIAALKAQLANYKVPKHLHVVPELPRNAMGKVQKNVLRERYKS